MNLLQYPINLTFQVSTFSNDFIATDVNGRTIAYVRQKMMKLIDEVQVFSNESRSELKYTIRANKWLDFSASYVFTNRAGYDIGRVVRKGWSSIWKAHYEIYDEKQQVDLLIREENPWAKVFDSLLGEIPLLGFLTGYFFHPSYSVSRPDGTVVVRLIKLQSFFGRKFMLNKINEFQSGEEERTVLGLMMMILLERRRG